MSFGAKPIKRGCGRRKAGGCYMELGLAPDGGGLPIEHFLLDVPLPADNLSSVTPVGVSTMERDGVTHVLDWVGSSYYPNVADFIEEVRVAGLSRRLPSTFDFSKLTAESRILTIHARAWVDNIKDYRPERGARYRCPKNNADHQGVQSPTCLGVVWEDVEGGESDFGGAGMRLIAGKGIDVKSNIAIKVTPPGEPEDPRVRLVVRDMPGFRYSAFRAPEGVVGEYRPAIFASWPISRLVVVKDPAGDSHQKTTSKVRKSILEVAEVDE